MTASLRPMSLKAIFRWSMTGTGNVPKNSFRRAIELDSNNLDAHFSYSLLLMALGRFSEAITEIQTAERLDPLSHQVQVHFGRILLHAGRARRSGFLVWSRRLNESLAAPKHTFVSARRTR